jgi:hypothetical protein
MTEQEKQENPAVAVAKAKRGSDENGIEVLSTGIRARIVPVAASLIDEAMARIRDPQVPVFMNEDKGRKEENPLDPVYLEALADARRKRIRAGLDVMIMFGVELADGVPEDDGWVKRLRLMEKMGYLDLGEFDFDEPVEREFLYKSFIAVASADLIRLGVLSGISRTEVAEAAANFPDNT